MPKAKPEPKLGKAPIQDLNSRITPLPTKTVTTTNAGAIEPPEATAPIRPAEPSSKYKLYLMTDPKCSFGCCFCSNKILQNQTYMLIEIPDVAFERGTRRAHYDCVVSALMRLITMRDNKGLSEDLFKPAAGAGGVASGKG